jgi:hypothetical protein
LLLPPSGGKAVEKPLLEDHLAQDERLKSQPHHCPIIPHTQMHRFLRRTLEMAQDVVVVVLMVMLLAITVQALWQNHLAAGVLVRAAF